jgi:hypothetical protein
LLADTKSIKDRHAVGVKQDQDLPRTRVTGALIPGTPSPLTMTMRCAFGKRALANQIGGQCAGSARANPAHANVFYFFISSFFIESFFMLSFDMLSLVIVSFFMSSAAKAAGAKRYGQTERSGSKSLDRDGTGHCLILLRMSMVLIAPPPSNSIRYRPRLHQPATSWTAST